MRERFTRDAREVVALAEREARALGAAAVGTEHILVALLERCGPVLSEFWLPPFLPRAPVATAEAARTLLRDDDPDADALASIGISLGQVRRAVEEAFGSGAWERPRSRRRLPFTEEAKRALEQAVRELAETRGRRLDSRYLLLGLLREDTAAARLVAELGLNPRRLYERTHASLHQLVRMLRS